MQVNSAEIYTPLILPQQDWHAMSEAVAHIIPNNSNAVEDAHTFLDHLRKFAQKNRDVLTVLTGIGVSMYVSRSMFRRELTRLQFNVEVFPYEQLTHTDYEYIDD